MIGFPNNLFIFIFSDFILNGIPRSLLRGFQVFAKPVPEGAKFRNTLSACGGDRDFEDIASLFITVQSNSELEIYAVILQKSSNCQRSYSL